MQRFRKKLSFSWHQIQYACTTSATLVKRSGCPPLLRVVQIEELIEYVCASARNRGLSYEQLAKKMNFEVGKKVIRTALIKEGFHWRLALRKPPISERNQVVQLQWALDHINWTLQQWYSILWTDETWVTGGRHTRTWVTRRAGEEWEPTCIVEKHQRRKGWMFWDCFHGDTRGPGIFWEKDWGSINSESYCAHTVPIIHGYLELCRRDGIYLQLMQDGAPGHAAGDTARELQERGIQVIHWRAFSPDLNPIERV